MTDSARTRSIASSSTINTFAIKETPSARMIMRYGQKSSKVNDCGAARRYGGHVQGCRVSGRSLLRRLFRPYLHDHSDTRGILAQLDRDAPEGLSCSRTFGAFCHQITVIGVRQKLFMSFLEVVHHCLWGSGDRLPALPNAWR